MKSRKDIFIEKAIVVHKGEKLDYSQVEYINNRTPVKIIDHDIDENGNEYGEFWQTPSNHLKGQSHPRKKNGKISASKRSKQEEIIARFKEIHKGENLDYSQVNYVNMHTKVKIICHEIKPDGTEYGEFWQEPCVHLKGCTHPDLGKFKQSRSNAYDTEIFVKKAKIRHANEDYSYDLVEYKKSQDKVCIVCNKKDKKGKIHGKFFINPDAFLQGKGCPKCGNQLSYGEDEIYEYIKNRIGENNIIRHDKNILEGKEIDLYIPSFNLAIEYNGLRWHSEEFNKDKNYHLNKMIKCNEKGIRLIHIFEDEYIEHKNIVLNKIGHLINADKYISKIYARKCEVKEISDKKEINYFLDKNHLQGHASYSIAIGCYYNGNLIGVMTFIKEKNEWNLNRLCTDIDYNCIGVASKMFKYFVNIYKPYNVKSFLDLRWGDKNHNIYITLGFEAQEVLKPNYCYTNGHNNRKHKFGFRKKILSKKYNLPLSMTEYEMTKEIGYYRIWDCGLVKYVWKREH